MHGGQSRQAQSAAMFGTMTLDCLTGFLPPVEASMTALGWPPGAVSFLAETRRHALRNVLVDRLLACGCGFGSFLVERHR